MPRGRPSESTADGRVLRGERSRRRIVDAMIALVRAGHMQPTAEMVATRAGVGIRTVFRHFEDMETLTAAVATEVQRALAPDFDLSPIEGTAEWRAHEIVRRRARLYERLAPFRRAEIPQRDRSRTIRRLRASLDALHRAQIETVFAPELRGRPPYLVEALDALASFEAWDRLRVDQRLGRPRAAAAMECGILAILGCLR